MNETRVADSQEPSLDLVISEVRYSLMEMLKEVDIERRHSNLGREKVDQAEIQKLFKKKRKRVR